MMMPPGVRKFALTAHVTSSVGWLGSVAAFLALAIAGLSSPDAQMMRGAYLAMHLTTWFVIVPLSVASLLTGFIESLGTTWGLFRHYWVVTKLLLTVLATFILLLHTQPIDHVAAVAAQTALSSTDLRQVRIQLIADAGAALFVLLVTTALSVYKPWGMTPYGLRQQYDAAAVPRPALVRRPPSAGRYVLLGIIVFFVIVVIFHLAGGGLHGH
jgi:hypothetical protein